RERLAWLLERLEGVLRAVHAAPALLLARHPIKPRFDAFWLVQGRIADWGPLPGHSQLVERTAAALERRPGPLPPDEVDEIRILSSWAAEHEPPRLELHPRPDADSLRRFVARAIEAPATPTAPLPTPAVRAGQQPCRS